MNFHVVVRFALFGDEPDDAVDFLIGDESALRTDQFPRTGRQVKHVAFAEQFVRAHGVENRPRVHP